MGFHILPARAQWEQLQVGNFVTVYAVGTADNAVLAGTDQGIYQRKYGSWTKVDSVSAFCVAGNDTEVFAGTYHGVIRSDNKGKTWSIPDSSLGRINALAINKTTIYAVGSGLYKSKDNGKTWNKIKNGLSQNMYPIHGITINDTLLLAATNTGLIISADGGKHWTIPSQPGGLTDYSITHIDTTLFAGTSKGLLRSTDGGKKWIRVASIADTLSVYSLAVNTVQSYLYAGTDIGVFRSTNQGKTWTAINNWLPTYPKQVYSFFMLQKYRKNMGVKIGQGLPPGSVDNVYSDDNYIFADVSFSGIWRRPIFQITALPIKKQPVPSVPSHVRLEQNYPNPFNPTTTIRYNIPARAHVRLTVYNVLGQRVETLVNKEEAPGQYTVQFHALRLASGVYLYRLRAGNFVETKKLVLLK